MPIKYSQWASLTSALGLARMRLAAVSCLVGSPTISEVVPAPLEVVEARAISRAVQPS